MEAPCEIQRSIHVFRLVNNMCPGKWVHITMAAFLPLSNGESETVFTTCINNNIEHGHKMPHSIDTNS